MTLEPPPDYRDEVDINRASWNDNAIDMQVEVLRFS